MLKKRFFFFIITSLFAVSMMAANKAFTLVIDPGHGGKDTGAAGAFSKGEGHQLDRSFGLRKVC